MAKYGALSSRDRKDTGMDRRTLLAGVGLAGLALGSSAVLTSCTDDATPTPTDSANTDAPTSDDANVIASAAANEVALIGRYEQVLAAGSALTPAVANLLTEILQQHRLHLQALSVDDFAPASQTAGVTPTLADLTAAERAAADERTLSCESAADPNLARTLALIAASEASHAQALTTAGSR